MARTTPPVRQMVYEAVEALGGRATNTAIRDWIIALYPETHLGTISCQTIACTVNHYSRVHYAENNRPRQAVDPRYDYLYSPARGIVEWYDPQQHGVWFIIQKPDGKLTISQSASKPTLPVRPSRPISLITPRLTKNTPVAVTHTQIEVATTLFARYLPQWVGTEKIFRLLRERFPDFAYESVIVKAATLNHLYSTRVFALQELAQHIESVMKEPWDDPVELITRLATPTRATDKGPRHYWSFAAKFTHFFVDGERFPIYDSYNEAMLRYHLGPEAIPKGDNPINAFVGNLQRFQHLWQLNGFSLRELDRYLWLAGLYRDWWRGNRSINVEVLGLFNDPGEAQPLLDILVPPEQRPATKALPAERE